MTRYDPRGAACLRLGRFNPDEAGCDLWWSGSGVRTRFDGRRLEAEFTVADDEHTPFAAVTVDGAPVARFALMPGTHRYDLLGRMEAGAAHDIEIRRDSQPTDCDTAPVVLNALHAEGTLTAPAAKPRLIEFLGDSLTVGEGTVGARSAMEWRMAWISNQFAFPALTAQLLDAEKRVVALGGWGVWRAWDTNEQNRIGRIYDRLCAVVPEGDVPYDFSRQRAPDAVIVNLGTNDASALDKLSAEGRTGGMAELEDSAVALMELVRLRNPGAVILWAYGLCGGAMHEPLRRAVERRRAAGDADTHYLALDDCAGDLGSRSHPGRASHARAAAQIAEALEKLKGK